MIIITMIIVMIINISITTFITTYEHDIYVLPGARHGGLPALARQLLEDQQDTCQLLFCFSF